VQGDRNPRFSRPLVEIENRSLLDFASLPDGRVLMVVRGDEELVVDRVELGLRSLLGD